jgi:hypothetical protein
MTSQDRPSEAVVGIDFDASQLIARQRCGGLLSNPRYSGAREADEQSLTRVPQSTGCQVFAGLG